MILDKYADKKIYILSPLVKNRKGHYKDLFEQLRKKGYLTVRVDGELKEIMFGMKLDRYKNHSIELVIDKLKVNNKDYTRLKDSVEKALQQGGKQMMIYSLDDDTIGYYSQLLMDPVSGISYREPAPHNFSFNSPQGACPLCKGLGYVNLIDRTKLMPNENLSIHEGGIVALGPYKNTMIFWQIDAICSKYGYTLKTPIKELSDEVINDIMNGTNERLPLKTESQNTFSFFNTYEGLVKYLEAQQSDDAPSSMQKWSGQFYSRTTCPECGGQRLNQEALHFYIAGKNIAELAAMDISALYEWVKNVTENLDKQQSLIGKRNY